jgi:hypothetical protein
MMTKADRRLPVEPALAAAWPPWSPTWPGLRRVWPLTLQVPMVI